MNMTDLINKVAGLFAAGLVASCSTNNEPTPSKERGLTRQELSAKIMEYFKPTSIKIDRGILHFPNGNAIGIRRYDFNGNGSYEVNLFYDGGNLQSDFAGVMLDRDDNGEWNTDKGDEYYVLKGQLFYMRPWGRINI